MRLLFIIASARFWLAILGFASSQLWLPAEDDAPPRVTLGDARHSLAEIARHDTLDDCWMAIDGQVYDLSGYLPEHPNEPEVILAWPHPRCRRRSWRMRFISGRRSHRIHQGAPLSRSCLFGKVLNQRSW